MRHPKTRIAAPKPVSNLVKWVLALSITGCQPERPISDVRGDITVLVPVAAAGSGNQLSRVTLKGITNLKEVSGRHARFFYSPGEAESSLAGSAPSAKFIRTNEALYVPTDSITQEMVTVYYHIQNLREYSAQISPDLVGAKPFQIGLNTKASGADSTGLNNAFFDGDTQALLFVPFSLADVPISVNSGIIAHEYFHSLFYKLLLEKFNVQQAVAKKDGVAENALLYNQTLVRGLNEGLADYWGWAYTDNPDYIAQSLPRASSTRKLELSAAAIGKFESAQAVGSRVEEALLLAEKPSLHLSGYIYRIGTPYARFLKQLTVLKTQEAGIDLSRVKLEMAKSIYAFVKFLSAQVREASGETKIGADALFNYYAQPSVSGIDLTKAQCDFVLKYVDKKDAALKVCQGSHD